MFELDAPKILIVFFCFLLTFIFAYTHNEEFEELHNKTIPANTNEGYNAVASWQRFKAIDKAIEEKIRRERLSTCRRDLLEEYYKQSKE